MPSHYPPNAQIEIDAPLQTVWDVLLDGERYSEWNRFIPDVIGELQTLNAPIHMRVKLGNHMTVAVMQTVTVSPPNASKAMWIHEHASWLAKTGLVRSRRHHELTVSSEGTTLYNTWEPFSGLLKPFVPFAKIHAGFNLQAADLKVRCERWASGHVKAPPIRVD